MILTFAILFLSGSNIDSNNVASFLSLFLLSPLHDETFLFPLLSLVILVDEGNEIPWFFSSFKIQKNYWDMI